MPRCGHGQRGIVRASTSTKSGCGAQAGNGPVHGKESRLIDVDAVDFLHFRSSYGPADGIVLDLKRQPPSLFLIRNFFRIVKTGQFIVRRKNDGGGYNGPGKRCHARFVDTGNKTESLIPEFGFKLKQLLQPPVLLPAFQLFLPERACQPACARREGPVPGHPATGPEPACSRSRT